MKGLDLVVLDKKIFENCILKTFLTPWPILQPIGNVWTILVGYHKGLISIEFGQIPFSGSGEAVWSFPYIIQCQIVTPGAGSILTTGV